MRLPGHPVRQPRASCAAQRETLSQSENFCESYHRPAPRTPQLHHYNEKGQRKSLWPVIDGQGRKRIRRNAYQGLNFHELRHAQATLLIGNGADIKTAQHRLGHSSASLTMNIYAHAVEQNDREAADAIGGILAKKPSSKWVQDYP